jgi:glycosyltransferase involved in cell wall biosynthesis
MIAYHFPPMKGSSGIQRTLRFAQYLPDHGWAPIVLAPHQRVYSSTSDEDMGDSLNGIEVHRSFALDASTHLSIRGRYSRLAALPDRWSSWLLGAVPKGVNLIRKLKPDVIWTTYPIATAHLIGHALHSLTGVPWIADFRDPMAQENYPTDPLTWKSFDWVEKRTVHNANAITFTTPGALREYKRRYPQYEERFSLIENGFDEAVFASVGQNISVSRRVPQQPFTLVHSGIIYPHERDPRRFFAAIAHLLREGEISPARLQIVLRATGHDSYLHGLIEHHGIQSIVTLGPSVSYELALGEMMTADGLLILQAANCNEQIPAKLYEYLRARRPILGLTNPQGDTGQALASVGIDTIASLESEEAIVAALRRFLQLLESGSAPLASDADIAAASRQGRTVLLAKLLSRVAAL